MANCRARTPALMLAGSFLAEASTGTAHRNMKSPGRRIFRSWRAYSSSRVV